MSFVFKFSVMLITHLTDALSSTTLQSLPSLHSLAMNNLCSSISCCISICISETQERYSTSFPTPRTRPRHGSPHHTVCVCVVIYSSALASIQIPLCLDAVPPNGFNAEQGWVIREEHEAKMITIRMYDGIAGDGGVIHGDVFHIYLEKLEDRRGGRTYIRLHIREILSRLLQRVWKLVI
ncbi:hypothetical protein BDP27DRAFT_492236 [Rhodocollybia butyracea]|uniref:Uncharacterized protein n=1 Tax=Rhodocollybia butyracea TaxID=206335 RepID=A0A9P5UG22_9AGAR|nr:hypothetical protein BDP27DRAFT_492236 [Rhodocollybia butyracea]